MVVIAVGPMQMALLLVGREVYLLLGPNIAFIMKGRVLTLTAGHYFY